MPQLFIIISIVIIVLITLLVFFMNRGGNENRITPLAGLAFAFVIAGIVFGDDRLIGYSLLGVGVILAIADMVNRSRRR